MARKLKTFVTNLGFFELALAAPSMKAALEAWGMGHNAFHQGFAKETHDPKIVAATMAHPGAVLKRPVGTKGAFTPDAKLPKDWSLSPPEGELPKAERKAARKPKGKAKVKRAAKEPPEKEKAQRAAIISFEKEKARRESDRVKQAERDEAEREKEQDQREREADKAQAAMDRAEAQHADAMEAFSREQEKLDGRVDVEKKRWKKEQKKLTDALRKA